MMSLSLGSSSLYLQNKCIPPFFLINSQKSLLKMTQWWPIISISRDVLVWCVPADDLECWAMFALCLSQCPGWLNPSKNLLLVFLRKLINTWPLQWKNEIGQLGKKKKICIHIYPSGNTDWSKAKEKPGCARQFTLRLALLVSLLVSHNKHPSHWLWRRRLPFAGVLNGLHATVTCETVQDFAVSWHEWAVVKPVQITGACIYLIILLRKHTGPQHDPKRRFNGKRPNAGLISRY